MAEVFRTATPGDLPQIMQIIHSAQLFLKEQGVDQWQNGYPDEARITGDISGGTGHVLCQDGLLAAYGVLTFSDETSYAVIHEGTWENDEPYGTLHRLASAAAQRGGGASAALLGHLEQLCRQAGYSWMRTDTHRHNAPMRSFLEKHGYSNRGIIYLAQEGVGGAFGDERIAYEKHLV